MRTAGWSTTVWAALVAMVLVGAPCAVHAEDDAEAEMPPVLDMRLYGVGALTNGRYSFTSSFPPVQPPDWAGRAGRCDRQTPMYPLGMVDELIELVKSHVDPAFWESTEGVDIASMGEGGLVVRASGPVHLALARYLASLERRLLRTVVVDVQSVRLTPQQIAAFLASDAGSRLDDRKVTALLAEARGPAVRLVLENRTRGEAFGGAQRAYLRRHEAVSAEGGGITVPLSGVANPGFAVSVEPTVHAEGRSVRLRMNASWSKESGRPPMRTAKQEIVELPAAPTLDIQADLIVTPGVWSLAHADSNGWSLLVRVTPGAGLGLSRTATTIPIGADIVPGDGPFEIRNFDVAALSIRVDEDHGSRAFLHDTSADSPAAPDEEGSGAERGIGPDSLVELVRYSIGHPRIWEDPATIEARNGTLIVRNRGPVLAAVEQLLDTLRRETPAVFSTRVELIEVEAGLRRHLLYTPPESAAPIEILVKESRDKLEAAIQKGEATRLGGGVLTSIHGLRNVLRSGQRVTYLSTYRPVRKTDGIVIEPVTASVHAGLELELRASLAPGARAVQLDVRCMHTRLASTVRKLATGHGEIELPWLDTLSMRATLTAPLGRTVVAAVLPHAGREVLLLLTPQRQSRDR